MEENKNLGLAILGDKPHPKKNDEAERRQKLDTHLTAIKSRKKKIIIYSTLAGSVFLTSIGAGIGISMSQGLNNEKILPEAFLNINEDGEVLGFNQTKQINGQTFRIFLTQHRKIDTISFSSDVKKIGANAFNSGNPLYQENWLPNTITHLKFEGEDVEIGENAFNSCFSLKTLDLQNVKKIGNNCFFGCSISNKITFDMTSTPNTGLIGESAFENNLMEEIDFSNCSATNINFGSDVFDSCNNLVKLYCRTSDTSYFQTMKTSIGLPSACQIVGVE